MHRQRHHELVVVDRNDGEQSELIAAHALNEQRALCQDVDRLQNIVMNFDRKESLEQTDQSAVPGVHH